MKTAFTACALLVALALPARAQAQANLVPLRQTEFQAADDVELYKDPLVAVYLSATLPGLGQFYSGEKKRGLLFLAR